MTATVQEWLISALFWLAIVTLIIGIVFIVIPGRVSAWAARLNQWVPTDRYVKFLDRVQTVERHFYRHHRVFGAIIVLGGLYVVYVLYEAPIPYDQLPVLGNKAFSEWLYAVTGGLLLAFNAIAVVAGVLIFARPSLLKRVEDWSNRWVSSEGMMQGLDSQHFMPEQKLLAHARVLGLVILLGSSYILWRAGSVLFR